MPICNTPLPGKNPVRAGLILAVVVALAVSTLLAWPTTAAAQINRCQRPDGTMAYTDHRCSDIGAVPRLPRSRKTTSGTGRVYRGGCPRNVQDLVYEMTTAIDARDANRLASLYHWVGVSSRGAVAVMDRLDAVGQRPLVDIVMVVPEPAPLPAPLRPGLEPVSTATTAPATAVTAKPGPRPPASREPKPVALRVVQTLANTATPSETVFGLHRYFGCVWITR